MLDIVRFKTTVIVGFYAAIIVAMMSVTDGSPASSDYLKMRAQIVSEDSQRRIGGLLVLSAEEKIVSDIFMKEKIKLIEDSRSNRSQYVPALSFYQSKPIIENSTLLRLIQRMPKGAALHLHDTSATSLDWLIKNATYRDHIYMCVSKDGLNNFQVFLTPPNNPDCLWKSVKEERAKARDVAEFDLNLKRGLSLMASDPLITYPDNARVWVRFVRYFQQVQNLVYYAPIFRDYFWRALEEFRADNVQYIEIRSGLEGVFELDGTVHGAEFAVQIYKTTTEEFMKAYPDFSGAKIIMSGLRNSKFHKILKDVKTAMTLNQKYPNFMMGYDLVGNEAYFNPLLHYIDALLYPAIQNPPYRLQYFFHVGETNWQNTPTDDNMADAILLNATRIGHGYALPKRPKLLQMVKERNIPVEVNPLSNQVLRLLSDLRNHPMISLMSDNFPIVISSDDRVVWEALPLSHDIYMAFTDMSGQDADLTFLKQLAINSIKYSTMNTTEKDAAMTLWEKKWNRFIQENAQEIPQETAHENSSENVPSEGSKPSGDAMVVVLFSLVLFYLCNL